MTGRLSAAVALLAVALAAGCTICSAPYDYCGPTFTGHGPCDPNARAGSILAGGYYEHYEHDVHYEGTEPLWGDAGYAAPGAGQVVYDHAQPVYHDGAPQRTMTNLSHPATARWTPRAMATTRQ